MPFSKSKSKTKRFKGVPSNCKETGTGRELNLYASDNSNKALADLIQQQRQHDISLKKDTVTLQEASDIDRDEAVSVLRMIRQDQKCFAEKDIELMNAQLEQMKRTNFLLEENNKLLRLLLEK